jgi:hypothetical protein
VIRDVVLGTCALVLVGMAIGHFHIGGLRSWELVVDLGILYLVLRSWRPWRRPPR